MEIALVDRADLLDCPVARVAPREEQDQELRWLLDDDPARAPELAVAGEQGEAVREARRHHGVEEVLELLFRDVRAVRARQTEVQLGAGPDLPVQLLLAEEAVGAGAFARSRHVILCPGPA